MAEVSQSSTEPDLGSLAAAQAVKLRAELAGNDDLIRLVERVTQTRLPWVVIPGFAITRWKMEDPVGWEKVSEWLAVHGVAIVRI